MPKLGETFPTLVFPTRAWENWKYISLQQLRETSFNFPSPFTVNTEKPRDTSLQDHPFAALALHYGKKIDDLEISAPQATFLNNVYTQEKNGVQLQHQRIRITEKNSVEIQMQHVSQDDSACFSALFLEIFLEKEAQLSVYKQQQLNPQSFLVEYIVVHQAQHSSFYHVNLDQGATLARTDVVVHLNEPHASAQLCGAYLTAGKQTADHHSVIYHHAPQSRSAVHYRGILKEQSKAVFNSKVIMKRGAQKSSTQQLNKNILLSNQAEIDTKPELEIYTDDIQATHGATVGQLDLQALFYLQARGIERAEAQALLLQGFLQEVFLSIPNSTIQEQFLEKYL